MRMHFAPGRLDGSFHTHASSREKRELISFAGCERGRILASYSLLILDSFERKGAHIFNPLGNLCPIKTREGWPRGKVLMVPRAEVKLKICFRLNFWTSALALRWGEIKWIKDADLTWINDRRLKLQCKIQRKIYTPIFNGGFASNYLFLPALKSLYQTFIHICM